MRLITRKKLEILRYYALILLWLASFNYVKKGGIISKAYSSFVSFKNVFHLSRYLMDGPFEQLFLRDIESLIVRLVVIHATKGSRRLRERERDLSEIGTYLS